MPVGLINYKKKEMKNITFRPQRQFSQEEIATICECANMGFSLEQTAIVLQVSFDDFLTEYNDKDSDVRKSYDLGYLKSRLELNRKINALAQNGSAAAQSEMRKIQSEQDIKNFMDSLDD